MLAGIETRFGGQVHLQGLSRSLVYEDLVVLNCVADLSPTLGSAFAAWDSLTKDGSAMVGCALDWYAIPGVAESQVVLVHGPPPEGRELGWVSVVWPGSIGCVNGMNADGVTVSMLNVDLGSPDRDSGFVPRGLMLRRAIGQRCDRDPVYEVPSAMKRAEVSSACSVLVSYSRDRDTTRSPAGLVEYVGRFNDAYDFRYRIRRGRYCDGTRDEFIIGTNQFGDRESAQGACARYHLLAEELSERASHQDPLTLADFWDLLAQVQAPRAGMDGWVTYQAVVFEPGRRKMHIFVSEGGKPALECRRATVDVEQLLSAE